MLQDTRYKIQKLHRILFYIFLILLPTQLGYHFWPDFSYVNGIRIDYLSPTIFLTDVILAGILFAWLININVKHLQKYSRVIILLASLLAINIVFSLIPTLSILKAITIVKLILLSLYIRNEKPDLKISIYCLLSGVFYSSLIAWVQFTGQSSIGRALWFLGERAFDAGTPGIAQAIIDGKLLLRPYATFPHPNVLAGFIVILLPLIFAVKSKFLYSIRIPFALLLLSTLFITFSRSAWIVLIIIGIVWILKKRIKIQPIIILGAFLFALVIAPFIGERIFNLFSVDMQSITRRIDLTVTSFEMIKDHPLVGVGLNNFISSLPKYMPIRSYQDLQPAHNIYLLFTAETGLIGLSLMIWLFFLLFKLRTVNWELRISLLAIVLLGLFDHYPYTIHQTQLLTAILVGFILTKQKIVTR